MKARSCPRRMMTSREEGDGSEVRGGEYYMH